MKDSGKKLNQSSGVFSSTSTTNLKSIANKGEKVYKEKLRKEQEHQAKDKQRKAEPGLAKWGKSFRPQPFVSPISGPVKTQSEQVKVVVAHGEHVQPLAKDRTTNQIPPPLQGKEVKQDVFEAKEPVAGEVTKLFGVQDLSQPIQGRFAFEELELEMSLAEIEIKDGEAVGVFRIKLDEAAYAHFDKTLEDAIDEALGPRRGPRPFRQIVKTPAVNEVEVVNAPESPVIDDAGVDVEDEILDTVADVNDERVAPEKEEVAAVLNTLYDVPSLELLEAGEKESSEDVGEWVAEKMEVLESTFMNFGVRVQVTGNYVQGATVTQFEIAPEAGTKISRILGLAEDLKLSLAVSDLRIEQIQGRSMIGVEIPNEKRRIVRLKDILSTAQFTLHESPLFIGLGENIHGAPVFTDILTMPHGLIAGQTGSGKSVCINTLLISILYKATPEEVRLMLIDPKQVEMAPYHNIPHLVTPVITDEKKAATGLSWAVDEMERRYELFAKNRVRDIKTFNKRLPEFETAYEKLPYIVIVIDELADLMMVAAQAVEDAIMRLTQKARAAGIHLIVATQRPTVDVITGTIKSNIPTRIAFAVAQSNDSRVILDTNGAENLLGYGDMLLSENGGRIVRIQGSYVDDSEIEKVVAAVKAQRAPNYLIPEDALDKRMNLESGNADPLEQEAMAFFIEKGVASASSLQRKFSIGFNRAARMIDELEAKGWISELIDNKRNVLMTEAELAEVYEV